MKAYTDIEQSKILSKILPLESADMYYFTIILDYPYSQGKIKTIAKIMDGSFSSNYDIPCWSLAALFNYLREIDFFPDIEADEHRVTMNLNYYNEEEARPLAPIHNIRIEADSFIDSCYKLILKLHELNLL